MAIFCRSLFLLICSVSVSVSSAEPPATTGKPATGKPATDKPAPPHSLLNGTWKLAGGLRGALGPTKGFAPPTEFSVKLDEKLGKTVRSNGFDSESFFDDLRKRGHKIAATGVFRVESDDDMLILTHKDGNTFMFVGFIVGHLSRAILIPGPESEDDVFLLQYDLTSDEKMSIDLRSSMPIVFSRVAGPPKAKEAAFKASVSK